MSHAQVPMSTLPLAGVGSGPPAPSPTDRLPALVYDYNKEGGPGWRAAAITLQSLTSAYYSKILNGAGAPGVGVGANGDFYIDTANNAIYGPKTAGAWGVGTSIAGAPGQTGYSYVWSTSTAATDPTSGKIKGNNATLSLITQLYLSETTADALAAAGVLATWDDSTSTIKGTIILINPTTLATAIYDITALTDNGAWITLAVTHRASSGVLADGASLRVSFTPKGDKGDTGAAGANGTNGTNGTNGADGVSAGLKWLYDSATAMANPGTGDVRGNNATLASVSQLAISALCGEVGNPNVLAFLQALDDSTTTTDRGMILLRKAAAQQNWAMFKINSTITDNTTWVQVPVTFMTGAGTFVDTDPLILTFIRTGDKGSDGVGAGDVVGPAVAVDGRPALFDGTTGKLLKQASAALATVALTGAYSDLTGTPNLALKADLASPALTGTPTAPTAAPGTNTTQLATTAFVAALGALKADLASPALTGTPTAPTAAPGTNTTQLSTTAFVKAAIDVVLGGVSAAFDTLSEIATDLGLKMVKSANLSDVASVATAQNNLLVLAQGLHNFVVQAGGWKAKASGGATAGTYGDLPIFSFNGTTASRIRFCVPMPKSWDEGTIAFRVQGIVDTGGGASNVAVFKMAAQAYTHDDVGPTVTDLATGAQAVNLSWTADDDFLQSAFSSALTVAGSPAQDDLVVFELWRDPADAADNNTANFLLFSVVVQYTVNAKNET